MVDILTFADAITESEGYKKRHLILGNGFSIGFRADIFHYASLFGEADFSRVPEIETVFEVLDTQDFERAIRALESSSALVPIYAPNHPASARKMRDHAAELKRILVSTIANRHPETPNTITDDEFRACRQFLSHFLGPDRDGYVFTLNYDLLLYWALMYEDNSFQAQSLELGTNDGFGNDEDHPDADYVVWQGETAAHTARVHFLHGSLHLFDSGAELQKYTWVRKGQPLLEQARSAINANKFPLFVAEGTSTQKKDKIRHNAYLYQSFKVLTANANQSKHCFFVFGHSLGENDDHILRRLGRGRFKALYIGIFGDPNSVANRKIIRRARAFALERNSPWPLEVAFFDSASANVWGRPA